MAISANYFKLKNTMEKSYRLEANKLEITHPLYFNKKNKQLFLGKLEDTNGYVIIFDNCTRLEFKIYTSYVYRTKKKKASLECLLKSADELKGFMDNLIYYNLNIN